MSDHERSSPDSRAATTDGPGQRPPGGGYIRWLLVGLVVLVLLGGQALFWRAGAQTNKVALSAAPKRATVVSAKTASYREKRRYVGTLEPWIEARVGPQLVNAYVSSVLVRPGALVRRGDVLATLDCRETNASTQAIAQHARALEARQAALANQAARMGNLLSEGFVAPNELELRRAESETEQARLLATKAQLLGSSLAVSDCVLKAPFDGEIADRSADPGSFMTPGRSVVTVVDRKVVRVIADVPETDFEAVAVGTVVRLKMLATGRESQASISRRSPSADPGTRTIHIELDLPNEDHSIPVNTTAELSIDVGAPAPALELPLTAADVRGARANVVVIENGVARMRALKVLGEQGGSLYVEPALTGGAQVVTEGRAGLNEGDRVQTQGAASGASGTPAQGSGKQG